MSAPEKCPKCGMKFHRTVQDRGSHLDENDQLVSYSVDIDEFDCSSRGSRDGGFFSQSGICLMRERDSLRARVAELEASLAASVPREVAIETAALWGDMVQMMEASPNEFAGWYGVDPVVAVEKFATTHTPDNRACESQGWVRAALARAEAELEGQYEALLRAVQNSRD